MKIKPPPVLMDGIVTNHFDFELVESYLLEAGKVKMMIDGKGAWPAGYKTNWPDYVRNAAESYGYNPEQSPRPRPTSQQIDIFYAVMDWLPLIPLLDERKAVAYRMLINPRTDKHVYPYRRLGRKLRVSHEKARYLYESGVQRLITRLNRALK